jgi:hypothetical protein
MNNLTNVFLSMKRAFSKIKDLTSVCSKKKNAAGVNGLHRFLLRGSNTISPSRGKTHRTLAYA